MNFNPVGKAEIQEIKFFIAKDTELTCFKNLRKDDFNWCIHYVLSRGMYLQHIGIMLHDLLAYKQKICEIYNELTDENNLYIIEEDFKELSKLTGNPYIDIYFIRGDNF